MSSACASRPACKELGTDVRGSESFDCRRVALGPPRDARTAMAHTAHPFKASSGHGNLQNQLLAKPFLLTAGCVAQRIRHDTATAGDVVVLAVQVAV